MNITIFTANQPRHLALIREMSKLFDRVYVIQECKSVLPGYLKDFYLDTETMREYFSYVTKSEKKIFGELDFLPQNCFVMGLKCGDVSYIPLEVFGNSLKSDYYLVFGASFIKGKLADYLVEHSALNIHMGISPYYRGCSCNFWAIYDGHPEMVGATIHLLSKGLDSGEILYHALPGNITDDAFDLGMLAVKSAFESLIYMLETGKLEALTSVKQDKSMEIRYARNEAFTDEIARDYLDNIICNLNIKKSIEKRDLESLRCPYILEKLQ